LFLNFRPEISWAHCKLAAQLFVKPNIGRNTPFSAHPHADGAGSSGSVPPAGLRLDDLQQTLDHFVVPAQEQAELKAIVNGTRSDIVTDSGLGAGTNSTAA
jgi:hypothetical protein